MHGTFHVHARIARGSEARLTKAAFLLTGWTLLGTAWQVPAGTPALPSMQVVAPPAPVPAPLAVRDAAVARSRAAMATSIAAPVDRFVPVVRIDLPAPPPTEAEAPPAALASADTPISDPPAPLPPAQPEVPAVVALRPVDIEQIAQLDEPGTMPDDAALAQKAQIAQLSVPLAVEQELALLQEDAPAEVAVRLGDRTLGKVAVRVSQINTIDVQLSGLLDLVADRFAPEEFARLRGSAAAGSYVPLDQLRAVGLGLRYDPAYDELVVST